MDNVDCTGKSALLIGLEESRVKSCKYLLNQGCDINTIDNNGNSPLDHLENIKKMKNNAAYHKLLDAMIARICCFKEDEIQNCFDTKTYLKIFRSRNSS